MSRANWGYLESFVPVRVSKTAKHLMTLKKGLYRSGTGLFRSDEKLRRGLRSWFGLRGDEPCATILRPASFVVFLTHWNLFPIADGRQPIGRDA